MLYIQLQISCTLYLTSDNCYDARIVTGEEFGINSFKVFMAYKDVMMLEDHDIIECFKVNSIKCHYNINVLINK